MTDCHQTKIGTGDDMNCGGCIEGVLENLYRDLPKFPPGSTAYNYALKIINKFESCLENTQ